jgi:hypothetical protein
MGFDPDDPHGDWTRAPIATGPAVRDREAEREHRYRERQYYGRLYRTYQKYLAWSRILLVFTGVAAVIAILLASLGALRVAAALEILMAAPALAIAVEIFWRLYEGSPFPSRDD